MNTIRRLENQSLINLGCSKESGVVVAMQFIETYQVWTEFKIGQSTSLLGVIE
jgi:hypothetical protein